MTLLVSGFLREESQEAGNYRVNNFGPSLPLSPNDYRATGMVANDEMRE